MHFYLKLIFFTYYSVDILRIPFPEISIENKTLVKMVPLVKRALKWGYQLVYIKDITFYVSEKFGVKEEKIQNKG